MIDRTEAARARARRRARMACLGLCASLVIASFCCGCTQDSVDADAASDEQVSGTTRDTATPAGALPEPSKSDLAATARQVFFGDLHIHSSWSLDAFDSSVRVGPEQAYRYARGEAIDHVSGSPIRLAGPPLDFMALTDHAEYLGVVRALARPDHPMQQQPLIRSYLGDDRELAKRARRRIMDSYRDQSGLPALTDDLVMAPAWQELVTLANRYDEPGRFTALVGFEYSANPDDRGLHRNVLFRGDDVPLRPFSAMDSIDPEDLWHWMDRVRREGDDLIAIPHNSNGSDGQMFADRRLSGLPIDRSWAELRRRNEPLVEVMQIKGQSETHPILSPGDEWANFEITPWRTTDPTRASQPSGSYLRDALAKGLQLEPKLGVNPFVFGMIGSTDGHNASSPFEERNYSGKIGTADPTPEERLSRVQNDDGTTRAPVDLYWSAAGLAGVWADTNTRADLFDALRRRETFATSGPRIRLRFFGGFSFSPADAEGDLAARGYAVGVPMGGRLSSEDRDGQEAPTFLVAAQQDPLDAGLERLQIVKGWVEGRGTRERVFDVACADGARPDAARHRCAHAAPGPDPATCIPASGVSRSELRGWWRDPDYDPGERAFYYARVLQAPTCRWSTWDALRIERPLPTEVPAMIQERAVSSPIWLDPSARARPRPRARPTGARLPDLPTWPGSEHGDRRPADPSLEVYSLLGSTRASPPRIDSSLTSNREKPRFV